MQLHILIPLLGFVLCSAYTLSVNVGEQAPELVRRSRFTRALFAAMALCALCETMWNIEGATANHSIWAALSPLSIIAIGPLAVITTGRLNDWGRTWPRVATGLVFAAGLAIGAAQLWTGATYAGFAANAYGVHPIPGPMYAIVYSYVTLSGVVAGLMYHQASEDSPRFDERARGWMITVAIAATVSVVGLTDFALPLLGIAAPRLGTVALGGLGVIVNWTLSRRGSDAVIPTQNFISEHILHALNEGVAFVALDGRVLLVNEALTHLLAMEVNQIVGRPFGPRLPGVDLSSAKQRLDLECELVAEHDHTVAASACITTVRDSRGEPLGIVLVFRDLRELKTLKSRLITSGRLAAVGQMAAGIAHEINNPIAFVRTNLGVLREHWQTVQKSLTGETLDADLTEALQDGEELIDESVEGIDRAASIVRDVRELSHAGSGGRVHANLNDVIERVIRLVSPEMGPGVIIERRFGDDCRAEISPDQMSQVFTNLLTNALHAVGGQGLVVIETSRGDDFVDVGFCDDGEGVPSEIRDRIFDPFYTTKEVGVGTGLGLSISHEIVRAHGGELFVMSNEPTGARFIVRLAASPRRNE